MPVSFTPALVAPVSVAPAVLPPVFCLSPEKTGGKTAGATRGKAGATGPGTRRI